MLFNKQNVSLIKFFLFTSLFLTPQFLYSQSFDLEFQNDSTEFFKYSNYYSSMVLDPKNFNVAPLPYTPNLFQNMIVLYQNNFSKGSCQFLPSCSRYSYLAIEEFGTIKGITQTFDRLWRCNLDAQGQYPIYKGYLFDPPLKLKLNFQVDTIKKKSENSDDIVSWLIKNKEWDVAYRKILDVEYSESSPKNKLLLAKISLNMGNPQKALDWISENEGQEFSFIKSISNYRLSFFRSSKYGIEQVLREKNNFNETYAVLWLHCYLKDKNSEKDSFILNYLSEKLSNNITLKECLSEIKSCKDSENDSPIFSLIQSMLIPGLGQATNGFITDGIYALVFNGVLAFLTTKNIIDEDYYDAAFWGLGFTFTYSANLVAAYNAPIRRSGVVANNLHNKLNRIFNPYLTIQIGL